MSMRKARSPLYVLLLSVALVLSLFFSQLPNVYASSGEVIQNDVFWKDTSDNPIYSQGGHVLKEGNTYYWYGVKYNGAVTYYNNPSGKNSDSSFNAVTCYSSTDLVNWTFQGNVLTSAEIGNSNWVGRLGVVKNPNTGKYVLLTQYVGDKGDGILFATSSTPTGTFTYHHVQSTIANVVNDMSGDQTLFIDDDGKPYLIFDNTSGRTHMYVSPLRSSDYLNVEPATNIYNSTSGGREGTVMFKYNGRYYFCTSDLHGWNASHTYYISATNIFGPYSSESVMEGSDNDFSHVSQTGMMIPVNGSSGSFIIFAGDRWSDFAGNGLGYNQWVPITFNGSTPVFHSLSQWNLDEDAGTWSVGAGNNYILNPSVEADRVSQTQLTGWQNWTNLSGANPNGNVSGGAHTGRWSMNQWYSSAYAASMFQNITLPNGTYTLKAWVKSSGGQNAARIFVKNFGGTEKTHSINTSMNNWTEISISNIEVTNGNIQVGVLSDGNANNWVRVDDWSLVRVDGNYIKFKNRATGLNIDGMGRTSNGSNAGQWSNGSNGNQQWVIEYAGSYVKIRNRDTGLYLDGMGRTTNGSAAGQWSDGANSNQQWIQESAGSYVKFKNRGTGLYLDGMGRTTNGSDLGQWSSSSSNNQQWQIVGP